MADESVSGDAQSVQVDMAAIITQVISRFRAGDFASAERQLMTYLAVEDDEFSRAAPAQIVTPPRSVAAYLDNFVKANRKISHLAAVHVEMNAFDLNPSLWYLDAYGIAEDGGRDNFAWVGDFCAATEESLTISGIEATQLAFASRDAVRGPRGHLAGLLVLAKVYRLLHRALCTTRHVRIPLIASAHEWEEYTTEIPRPTRADKASARSRSAAEMSDAMPDDEIARRIRALTTRSRLPDMPVQASFSIHFSSTGNGADEFVMDLMLRMQLPTVDDPTFLERRGVQIRYTADYQHREVLFQPLVKPNWSILTELEKVITKAAAKRGGRLLAWELDTHIESHIGHIWTPPHRQAFDG